MWYPSSTTSSSPTAPPRSPPRYLVDGTGRARAHSVIGQGCRRTFGRTRERCADCKQECTFTTRHTPQPRRQPPSTPFEAVFADFFNHGGHHYLVVGDRLSGWVEVFWFSSRYQPGRSRWTDEPSSVILRKRLEVPEELSSDGGPEFHGGSYGAFSCAIGASGTACPPPTSPNRMARAEVAVKTAKRLLMSNTGPTGSLNHDRFLQAMLQLRNTPDPRLQRISGTDNILARPLRDTLSFINRLEKFSNPHVRPTWRPGMGLQRKNALCTRLTRTTESLKETLATPQAFGSRRESFPPEPARAQAPTKWGDRSGVVVEAPGP